MKRLVIASDPASPGEASRIAALARSMGLRASATPTAAGPAPLAPLLGDLGRDGSCVVMSADTLSLAHRLSPAALDRLLARCSKLLVFGWTDSPAHSRALARITGNALRGTANPPASSILHFPEGGRRYTAQLAGLDAPGHPESGFRAFDGEADAPWLQPLLCLGGRPVLLHVPIGPSDAFLLAGPAPPDVDRALAPGDTVEARAAEVAPYLVFFRHAYGDATWHGPAATARLIIDDPLLSERYGCLDYGALLASMTRGAFATSVAFIPWNFRRTSPRTAALLFGPRRDLSLCVHGCDHTNREFDTPDMELLEGRAGLALERMHHHRARTGLPYDPVMVFPQGLFSTEAIRALRNVGYLAAVNSSPFPTNARAASLRLSDLLQPAVTRMHGFPVFQRRYPHERFAIAFDLFLGKPALVATHHGDFRNGGQRIEQLVSELYRLESRLAWPGLSSQLARACLTRITGPRSADVRFFTRRFEIQNASPDRRRYRLETFEPDPSVVRAVLVDGRETPFSFDGEHLELEVDAEPGQERTIAILDHTRPLRATSRRGVLYAGGVFVRRRLSEFRDNTLSQHPRLLRAATGLARRVGATAGRAGSLANR